MSWRFKHDRRIEHPDGHFIELICGTWEEPLEIQARTRDVGAIEQARLTREGLTFAAGYAIPQDTASKPYTKKKRRLLTLKKD